MKSNAFALSNTPLSLILLLLSIFPLPTPAQTITYYDDVPLYTSLVQCAAIGCSVALDSLGNCGPTSPASAYASCACLKDQNSASITKLLTAVVQGACGTDATEDITSVLAVFHSWCQAVAPSKDVKVTATAAAVTSASATPGSGIVQPSSATATSTSPQTDPSSPGSTSNSGPSNGQWAAIGVGIAVAGVIVTALASLCAGWTRPEQYLWVLTCGTKGSRHRKPRHERMKIAGANGGGAEGMELAPVAGDREWLRGGGEHEWVQGGGWQDQGQGLGQVHGWHYG